MSRRGQMFVISPLSRMDAEQTALRTLSWGESIGWVPEKDCRHSSPDNGDRTEGSPMQRKSARRSAAEAQLMTNTLQLRDTSRDCMWFTDNAWGSPRTICGRSRIGR
jgi:hypothetical protein